MMRPPPNAFTMLELLIVVAVVAILTTVAVSSYNSVILKGKRAAAISSIAQCASVLENRFTVNGSYDAQACNQINVANTEHTITVTVPNNGLTFTITGAPVFTDDMCSSFTLDSLGVRAAVASDNSDNTAICWRS